MPILKRLAEAHRDKVAIRMADSGEQFTYAELDARADRVARWLLSMDLAAGDVVALLLENHPRSFELWWGVRRAGLYYTPISVHASADEAAYLLEDCGAKVLVTSRAQEEVAARVRDRLPASRRFMLDGAAEGFDAYEDAVAAADPSAVLPERPIGREFFYSSGTTGRPKGIRRPMQAFDQRYEVPALERQLRSIFRFDADTVYLSPSPLYHATSRFIIRAVECGGTAVVMDKFDAEKALEAIDRYRVTHSHWVPTMMIRMLALPDEVRARYDVSSMRCALHAAAPCPPQVKDRMIEWWGPVIEEYYGGSENAGVTYIDSRDWQAHRGSVGRPIWGAVHILGDDGEELPPGEVGAIYFSGSGDFRYHNDPDKTASAFSRQGWSTYGDMGHVDAEGYLYLSDRRADLIISGGVNIYPAEIENALSLHEAVEDVAVIGVPHEEFGQEVKAVVQLREPLRPSPELEQALIEHCRERISRIKCPRSIDFVDTLPRSENGKLLRRVLKERYRRRKQPDTG
ncbi:MAG: acyl-CoA synthetase [Aromatoleum sp.]|jgi:long-chain acyl-CoA synthetase|uniref:acyl-CoA synthetase n=1 Tax=Aromatoleum sp. TaxID=2307007 RepID=UPI002893B5D8|nr:acyl-CoA synthetase [Aromatoleum sp.]MDT3670171.1 acyl-CoA synthetase [Aromatoleum sp.]